MLDGLILQTVLITVWIVAIITVIVWFVVGITEKSAVWIITCAIPAAIAAAALISFITA